MGMRGCASPSSGAVGPNEAPPGHYRSLQPTTLAQSVRPIFAALTLSDVNRVCGN